MKYRIIIRVTLAGDIYSPERKAFLFWCSMWKYGDDLELKDDVWSHRTRWFRTYAEARDIIELDRKERGCVAMGDFIIEE